VDYRNVPVQEGLERAKEYARKAIDLDDELAEAHASLAWCLFIYDWDWEASDRESRRAIELDPRYVSAYQWYTFLLVSQQHSDAALASAQKAVELDPASVSGRRSIAWANYYARRFDQARYHAQRAIAMNPTAEESYRILGLALAQSREFDEAERVMREAVELPSGSIYAKGVLGYTLALSGQIAKARELLEELVAEAKRGYVSPVVFALLHIGLGERDRALDWMARAFEERRGWLVYLRVNAVFDPLRGDPRFEAIARSMQLSQSMCDGRGAHAAHLYFRWQARTLQEEAPRRRMSLQHVAGACHERRSLQHLDPEIPEALRRDRAARDRAGRASRARGWIDQRGSVDPRSRHAHRGKFGSRFSHRQRDNARLMSAVAAMGARHGQIRLSL
jgi:tetratricopeptide (TPR) repeat protein